MLPIVFNNFSDGNKEVIVVSSKDQALTDSGLLDDKSVSIKAIVPDVYNYDDIRRRLKGVSSHGLTAHGITTRRTLWGDDFNESMEDADLRVQRNAAKMASDEESSHSRDQNQFSMADSQIKPTSSSSDNQNMGESMTAEQKKKIKYDRVYKISKRAASPEISPTTLNLESKTKQKLKGLTKFVVNYTNRKIMSCWDLIESKFKSSPHISVMMEKGADGISYPVKVRVLHLSTLTILLCSPEIRVKHHELTKLLLEMGFPYEECEKARRIAACKLVMRTIDDADKRSRYHKFLESLIRDGEKGVSITQLKNKVFPSDPVEYAEAMDTIQKARTMRLAQMVEDRRIKQEMAQKSEQRRAKLVIEFEQDVRTIQFARGPMDMSRYLLLNSVVDFAKHVVYEVETAATAGIDAEVIELIGIEMFPRKIRNPSDDSAGDLLAGLANAMPMSPISFGSPPGSAGAVKRPEKSVSKDAKDLEVIAEATLSRPDKITLLGPPPLIELLRKCVATGKGLNGTSFAEVIELIQAIATTKMTATFRGHSRFWRYQKAKKIWRAKDKQIITDSFAAWSETAKHYGALKRRCWRKVKAWRYYTKHNISRRELFRICYWPFFVWRRDAIQSRTAKEKAKFLVGRVMPTVLEIRVFRAWKGYTKEQGVINNKARDFLKYREKYRLWQSLLWFRYWTRRRKGLRRAWYREGILKYERTQRDCMSLPFLFWKSYVYLKTSVKRRIKGLTSHVRTVLLKDRPIRHSLSIRQRNLLMKQKRKRAAEHRQKNFNLDTTTKEEQEKNKGQQPSRRHSHHNHNHRKKKKSVTLEYGDVSKLLRTKFTWVMYKMEYDVDSDEEYEQDLPGRLQHDYFASIPPLPKAEHIPFLQSESQYVQDKINRLQNKFTKVEVWGLLECAMVYQRIVFRAFRNLHTHAKIRRNCQMAVLKRKKGILRKCFDRLFDWSKLASISTPSLHLTMTRATEKGSVKSNLLAVAYDNSVMINHANGYGEEEEEEEEELPSNVSYAFDTALIPQGRTVSEILAYQAKKHRMEKTQLRKEVIMRIKVAEIEQRNNLNKEIAKKPGSRHRKKRGAAQRSSITTKSSVAVPGTAVDDDYDYQDRGIPAHVVEQAIMLVIQKNQSSSPDGNPVRPLTAIVQPLEITTRTASQDDGHRTPKPKTPPSQSYQPYPPQFSDRQDKSREGGKKPTKKSKKKSQEQSEGKATILGWDRDDREKELFLSQAMSACSKQMYQESLGAVDDARREDEIREKKKNMKWEAFHELKTQETKDSHNATETEIAYASEFKVNAAGILVNALSRVNFEWILQQDLVLMKHMFRTIRLPLMEKRSISMRNRVRIINWIRLCKRLQYISREAPMYANKRTQWVLFCRWIKLIEKDRFNASPGFAIELKKRCALLLSYCNYLKSRGFVRTVYPYETKMRGYTSEFVAIFKRWQQYTQESKMFTVMGQKALQLYYLRLKYKCLQALHSTLKKDVKQRDHRHVPFIITRASSDLDQLTKRFVAHRRNCLWYKVVRFNRRFVFCKIRDAKKFPTFKVFINRFKKDCSARIMMEQRLLVEAFEGKTHIDYKDVVMKSRMNVDEGIDGTPFIDPIPQKDNPSKTVLPPGFKISRFRVVHQEGMGIVGWQTCWSGDGVIDRESPKRGKWNGAGSQIHDLVIKTNDFLVGIECVFEGNVITGLRINCHLGGWSKYVGTRVSSAISYTLSASDVTKDPKGDPKIGDEELKSPGMPRNYITGIIGLQNVTRATGLGIVVRRVRAHSIFSYYWVHNHLPEEDSYLNPKPSTPPISNPFWKSNVLVESSVPSIHPSSSHPPGSSATSSTYESHSGYSRPKKSPESSSFMSSLTNPRAKKPDNLTLAEEEFFNVLRMRLTELHAAQGRAIDFARRIWSNPRLIRTTEGVLSTITIVPMLTKWFFESLCKYLVPPPVSESAASALQKSARLHRIRSETIRRRCALLTEELNGIVYEKNKWKIAKMNEKEKKDIQTNIDRQNVLRNEVETLKGEADEIDRLADEMEVDAEGLLPVLQMSVRVCNNFIGKIKAARHLSSLLEKMDIYTIKERLSIQSKDTEHSISNEDMELLSHRIRRSSISSRPSRIQTLDMVIQEDLEREQKKDLEKEREEKLRNAHIKAAIFSKSTDAKTTKELMKKQHHTRRILAVDPIRQSNPVRKPGRATAAASKSLDAYLDEPPSPPPIAHLSTQNSINSSFSSLSAGSRVVHIPFVSSLMNDTK